MNARLFVSLALAGIPLGAMYALEAMGIVLVYRTSRVFNFAQGAIGMAAAYLASFLGISLGLPAWVAVLVAVIGGGVLGLVMERLTIRPVEGVLARTIITLGWLLGLQGIVGVVFGTGVGRRAVSLFPSTTALRIHALRVVFGADQLGVVIVALALALGLGVFLRRSALGTAMRAVADDPEGAELLGIRSATVTASAWALGAGMAALAGVLVTPLLGTLDTNGLVILTIQALAAALVGGLASLPLTFVGGLALGAAQPVVARLVHHAAGTNELVAFVVVLAALVLRKRSGREDVSEGGLRPSAISGLPRGSAALASAGGIALGIVVLPLIGGPQWSYDLANTAVWALVVLSLVLLVGVVGQVSLCHAFFMAVGAYGGGMAYARGAPFFVALFVGALLAAAVAALVAIPAIRLRPLELAIVTLSLAFTADRYFYRWTPLVGKGSVRPLARPAFANNVVHGLAGARGYAWLALAVFVLAAWLVAGLRRGRTGASLTALRSSEVAAGAMGFWPMGVRLRGFAASGFVAGIAGVMFAGLTGAASYAAFDTTRSISLLAYAVIAGVGSVPGAVIGGLIVTLSTLNFGSGLASGASGAAVTLATGASLLIVTLLAPSGLAGAVTRLSRRLRTTMASLVPSGAIGA